jgi:DNA-binding NarL/FixJ family response regulator
MAHDHGDKHTAVRVMIVDDHWMFRQGVRAVLEMFNDQVEVVGEAASAVDAVEMVQERVPSVVLLDLQLPERLGVLGRSAWEHGVTAISQIARISPCTRVLVMSYHEEPEVLFAALRAGAHGYLTKGDHFDGAGLVDALCRTVAGEAFYGPLVAQLLREYHQQRSREPDTLIEPLTPREREVLDLLSDRRTNREIAEQLVISVKTVKTHVANILAKLHIESRHEVPMYVRLNRRDRAVSS